jgi:hypothetical protein
VHSCRWIEIFHAEEWRFGGDGWRQRGLGAILVIILSMLSVGEMVEWRGRHPSGSLDVAF